MSTKPVWLLDVDGVVNAVASKGDPNVWPKENWKSTRCEALNGIWPILYSQDVVDFINKMSERVEIRWHTTWQENAVSSLAPKLGIVRLEVAYAPEFHDSRFAWWKIPAAERVVFEEERPLIWTDDDIAFEKRKLEHIETKDSVLISPRTSIGLIPKQLKLIEEFVLSHETVSL